jgi:glutamate-ammonia-ligase adenylyltransferase
MAKKNNNPDSIPTVLQPALAKSLDRLAGIDGWPDIMTRDADVEQSLPQLLACSEYAADILARYPELLVNMLDDGRLRRVLQPGELDLLFLSGAPDQETEPQFMRRLRLFRHRELLRIIWRDNAGWSDCAETLAELSALADVCIRAAYLNSSQALQSRHGVPRGEDGEEAVFVIVAMGKLGGGELNMSSDVDLVFIYTKGGETDGARSLSNEDFFRRLALHLINLLSNQTGDGFVYRVDTRLRPFGDSGPLAVSVDAFEDYLTQHGRDWERYAWIKARAVNVWEGTRDFYKNILRPFVYRRYLDFGVFGSLREMKSMIELEGRAAANRENIKLGPGGIREIEFIAQTLQLVRGGTTKGLRQRSLMPALAQLGEIGLMPAETVTELSEAYVFLRRLENTLQAIADRQTHELPGGDVDRARLYLAMGFADWDALYAKLTVHREAVQSDFDNILHHERNDSEESGAHGAEITADTVALGNLAEQLFEDPAEVSQRVNALHASSRYQRMDKIGQQRLDQLLPAVLVACGAAGNPLLALDGVLRVVDAIGRRSAYIALLNENKMALERLVRLCGSSDFLARQIAAHPLLLDELLDQRIFMAPPARKDLEDDLAQRLDGSVAEDSEQRFEALRNFQRAAMFRVAVADLSGTLPLMKVSDRLTDIAELVLEAAIAMSMRELVARHGVPRCTVNGKQREAGFAIVGYGKLGGLELGYGSDLDIVFVHDSDGESQETDGDQPLENSMFFGRLARRITNILTMPTLTGALYEVDTRLRPSGKAGLLVTSLVALDTYQQSDAWTWEHQALLRARAVAGNQTVRKAFEALRCRALKDYVRRDSLQEDVVTMRTRMRTELCKSNAEQFDIKQGDGGLVDIEFLVQYLVLLHAQEHPALIEYSDNIRQLDALSEAAILTVDDTSSLADAYRAYRVRMHLLSLAGEKRMAAVNEFESERAQVTHLWKTHFDAA